MRILFALCAAALGGFFFGSAGFVIGLLLGFSIIPRLQRRRAAPVFSEVAFAIMGHIAKADGRISEEEIAVAEQLMEKMNLHGAAREEAILWYQSGTQPHFYLPRALERFNHYCRYHPQLGQLLLLFLIESSLSDGTLHPKERAVLLQVAVSLGYNQAQFEHMLDMSGAQHGFSTDDFPQDTSRLDNAYHALNIVSDASDRDVKRAYRQLMNRYHPDKMTARGVPKDMVQWGTEKTQQIQSAYNMIKKSRGMA